MKIFGFLRCYDFKSIISRVESNFQKTQFSLSHILQIFQHFADYTSEKKKKKYNFEKVEMQFHGKFFHFSKSFELNVEKCNRFLKIPKHSSLKFKHNKLSLLRSFKPGSHCTFAFFFNFYFNQSYGAGLLLITFFSR